MAARPTHDTTIAATLARAVQALQNASDTPRLDAEVLLGHLLGLSRARLLAERDTCIMTHTLGRFDELVARRANLEPVAYLVGHKEFFGLNFYVDHRVLVPRPETELLVELALEWLRAHCNPAETAAPLIADIGAGSGCIAVTLAVYMPAAHIYAVDISSDALAVARRNSERHATAERITFLQGDLLAPLPRPVQLLVSNPPYTILAQIDEGVRRHEPHLALDGGRAGLDVYHRLLKQAPGALLPGGALLLEIGADQGAAVTELAHQTFPMAQITLHQDLADRDRVVMVRT